MRGKVKDSPRIPCARKVRYASIIPSPASQGQKGTRQGVNKQNGISGVAELWGQSLRGLVPEERSPHICVLTKN